MNVRRNNDRGDTLVEILVALALLSIGVVALVAALATNVSTTASNRDQAEAETVLTSAAEYVKALTPFTFACPGGSATVVSIAALPRNAAYSVTYGPAEAVDGQACSKLVAVPVTVTGNGFTRSVYVVKRP